jgi:hypothetical protein
MKRRKRTEEKTQTQGRKDANAGKKRCKGGEEKMQRQGRKDAKAGKKRRKGTQDYTQRQARLLHSKAGKITLTGRED